METRFVDIHGLRVRYLETDGGGTIPLIILHGWGSSIDSWRNVASALEKQGIKVFIPDLPGFGETPEPPRTWSANDYVEFVKNFARELRIQKFVLAGHSFGGQVAISFTVAHQSDMRGLVLMAPARIMRRRKLRVKIFGATTKLGNIIFSIPILSFLRPLTQKIWYKLSGERDYYRATPLMRKTMKQVLGEEVGAKLTEIKIPTLILWGDEDMATPVADAHIIAQRIPNSALHIFPGVGHPLNIERAEEVAKKIIQFMHNL